MTRVQQKTLLTMGGQVLSALVFLAGIAAVVWGLKMAFRGLSVLVSKFFGFEVETEVTVFIFLFTVIILGVVVFGITHWYDQVNEEVSKKLRIEEREAREAEAREQQAHERETKRIAAEIVKQKAVAPKAIDKSPEVVIQSKPKGKSGRYGWLLGKSK